MCIFNQQFPRVWLLLLLAQRVRHLLPCLLGKLYKKEAGKLCGKALRGSIEAVHKHLHTYEYDIPYFRVYFSAVNAH